MLKKSPRRSKKSSRRVVKRSKARVIKKSIKKRSVKRSKARVIKKSRKRSGKRKNYSAREEEEKWTKRIVEDKDTDEINLENLENLNKRLVEKLKISDFKNYQYILRKRIAFERGEQFGFSIVKINDYSFQIQFKTSGTIIYIQLDNMNQVVNVIKDILDDKEAIYRNEDLEKEVVDYASDASDGMYTEEQVDDDKKYHEAIDKINERIDIVKAAKH
jgi:ribosome maturation factor RimP